MTDRIDVAVDSREVIAAFRKAPQAMTRHLRNAVSRAGQEVAREARRRAPKAHSVLTNAIRSRLVLSTQAEVVAGTDYARMVEEGTGPGGWPPRQTLLDWIRVKRIAPEEGRDEDDLVFLIQRKIYREGTPPQPYMGPALEAKRSRVQRLIEEGVARGVAEVFG